MDTQDDDDSLARKLVGKAISIVAKAGAGDEVMGALAMEYPSFVKSLLAEKARTSEVDFGALMESAVLTTLEKIGLLPQGARADMSSADLPLPTTPLPQSVGAKSPMKSAVKQTGELHRLTTRIADKRTTIRIPLALYQRASTSMAKAELNQVIETFANEPIPSGLRYSRSVWVAERLDKYMQLATSQPATDMRH